MHHPHVPHELKDFSKHLFATFLGLLMALGLEQWREHRHEAKVAKQALQAVKTEMAAIRTTLLENLRDAETHVKLYEERTALLEEVIQSKMEKRALRLPPSTPGLSGTELNFYWHAWDSAKSLGLLRHLRPDQVQRLSAFYGGLQRIQAIQDAMLAKSTGIHKELSQQIPLLQNLSLDCLQQLLFDSRDAHNLKRFTLNVHRRIPKEIDELLKTL